MLSSITRRLRLGVSSLCRRRSMFSHDELMQTPLRRCLTLADTVMFGIAVMAGSGIYVLTGEIVGKEAGAAACISYLLAGIAAIFTALCYTEFATLIPRAGSVYIYTFLTLGELPAFLIGWTAVSDSIVSMAAIAKAFSGTIDIITHGAISNWTIEHMGHLATSQSSILSPTYDFLAVGLIIVLTIIVASGAKSSMGVNAVITSAQLFCLLLMTIGCFVYGSSSSFSADNGGFAPFGLYGVINGATIAVFAYSGFDSIANAAEEMINPARDIPRAMLIIVVVCMILYFTASLGLGLLVPYDLIDFTSPFVAGFQRLGVTWLFGVASAGTLLATGASKVSIMFTIPRCLYAIGEDGLIFHCFAFVDKRTQVPQISLVFGALISMVLACFLNIQTLAEFVSLGSLFSYFTIGVDILVMRYLQTDDDRVEVEDKRSLLNNEETEAETSQAMKIREKMTWLSNKFQGLQNRTSFISVLISHILFTAAFALIVDYATFDYSVIVVLMKIIVILCWIISVALLTIYRPSYSSQSYQTPLMPMAPVLTIFTNAVLIFRLAALTWIRFAVWSALGLGIYFVYGRRHSVARMEREREEEYLPLSETKGDDPDDDMTSYGSGNEKGD